MRIAANPANPCGTTALSHFRSLHIPLDRFHADYTWVNLPEMGIKGNSHMLMMDNNNDQIAGLINDWLVEKGLCGNK